MDFWVFIFDRDSEFLTGSECEERERCDRLGKLPWQDSNLRAPCRTLQVQLSGFFLLFTTLCVCPNSYGLLGPSGCGKTTLLKCIVGTLKISRGHITVLGKPPAFPGHEVPGKMVGYMPQVSQFP